MNEAPFRDIGGGDGEREEPVVARGRSLLAVIGIDEYAAWPRLRNAVSDAIGFQRTFVERLGFTAVTEPLLNASATKDAMTALVNDVLAGSVEEDDALVLFYAGHGHTRVREVGGRQIETGFIVPVEARADTDRFSNDFIKIDQFLEDVSQLPARHILVVLDACNSGFALGSAMEVFRSAARFESDLMSRVSRKVITSARRDQLALDGGPVEGHSLFTGTLVNGFNWGGADTDSNGLVTSSELGLYLQQKVGQHSDSRQTPDFGSFALDDRGELVISLRSQTFDALKARAFAALQNGDFEQFQQLSSEVIQQKPDSCEALYLAFRVAFFQNDIDRALDTIHALLNAQWEPGAIPLSQQDVFDLSIILNYWRSVLSIPAEELPLRIELISRGDASLGDMTTHILNGTVVELDAGTVIHLRVHNLTTEPAHVYLVDIDVVGRLSFMRLWEDPALLFGGIAPGASAESFPFRVFDQVGVHEMRLYHAAEAMNQLLAPPSLHTRGIRPPIGADEVASLHRRTSIFYRALRPS